MVKSYENTVVSRLEHAINYTFTNKRLAMLALSHSSVENMPSNERLEFVGDRVLALAISTLLYAQPNNMPEGVLAKRLNGLVCRETCAQVGSNIDLGAWLLMSESEHHSGGRRKAGILSDACEAVIGAVFLDGGFNAAYRVVQTLWAPFIDEQNNTTQPIIDAKSRVQELTQKSGWPLPVYSIAQRSGPDHAPVFTIQLHVQGFEPVQAQGASRRTAEHAAAALFLQQNTVLN